MQRLRTLSVQERGEITKVTLHSSGGDGEVDLAMLTDFEELVVWLEDISSCSLVVFEGIQGVFCRGLNRSVFGASSTSAIHAHNRWEKVLIVLERLPKLTLAAIDGVCVGAGVQLALACD